MLKVRKSFIRKFYCALETVVQSSCLAHQIEGYMNSLTWKNTTTQCTKNDFLFLGHVGWNPLWKRMAMNTWWAAFEILTSSFLLQHGARGWSHYYKSRFAACSHSFSQCKCHFSQLDDNEDRYICWPFLLLLFYDKQQALASRVGLLSRLFSHDEGSTTFSSSVNTRDVVVFDTKRDLSHFWLFLCYVPVYMNFKSFLKSGNFLERSMYFDRCCLNYIS